MSVIEDKWECLSTGGEWVNNDSNFDDIMTAMTSLFALANHVGWVNTMHNGIASRSLDLEPKNGSRPYLAVFYIMFIIVGSFFILNLFVGVVISTYNREKEKLGKNFLLNDKQKKWLET